MVDTGNTIGKVYGQPGKSNKPADEANPPVRSPRESNESAAAMDVTGPSPVGPLRKIPGTLMVQPEYVDFYDGELPVVHPDPQPPAVMDVTGPSPVGPLRKIPGTLMVQPEYVDFYDGELPVVHPDPQPPAAMDVTGQPDVGPLKKIPGSLMSQPEHVDFYDAPLTKAEADSSSPWNIFTPQFEGFYDEHPIPVAQDAATGKTLYESKANVEGPPIVADASGAKVVLKRLPGTPLYYKPGEVDPHNVDVLWKIKKVAPVRPY